MANSSARARPRHDTTAAQVVAATADCWPDLEEVFGTRGDPSRCWCQWFFEGAQVGPGDIAAANKQSFRAQVEVGPPPGVVAYLDGQPAGWAAVAQRPCYGRLRRSTVLRGTAASEFSDLSVWSVSCFVVRAGSRRHGVSAALLHGAVDLARQGGAKIIEGYPVDLAVKPSVAAAELYHGALSTFLKAGFVEVARPLPARPVVRLSVGA